MSIGNIILYALMALSFYGMVWANRQYKGKGVPWGRPLSALCGALCLIFAIISISISAGSSGPSSEYEEIKEKEAAYQRIAYHQLGKKLAERHPNAKILLIDYSRSSESSGKPSIIEEAKQEGLQDGLDENATIDTKVYVKTDLDEYDSVAEKEQAMRELFSATMLDELISNNPQCNVVLSLVGMPPKMEEMALWSKKPDERPVLALVNAYLSELKKPIKFGFVSLVLQHKPGFGGLEEDIPADEQEAFDKRFMFVTPENIDKIAGEFPKLFGGG